jgi:hypothetical protein
MSTPEQRPADSMMGRYRAGLPARDQAEREAHQEWRELDADDLASAIEERSALDEAWERYDGALEWNEWREERDQQQDLERLGIARPELPAPYRTALGADRAARLETRVADERIRIADAPPSRAQLSEQAKQFGASARALDMI